jgi:hypothetical protein
MATYTGLILAGTPHPNDDGLLYNRQPRRLWLSENSRAAWCLDTPARAIRDGRRAQTVWIPKRPSSLLEDGLLMVAVMILKDKAIRSALSNVLDCEELPARIDLTKTISNEQHRCLIDLSRKNSEGYFFKLIISTFHGCSMEHQMPVLENYGYDVEVLTPAYTRLYCRWLNSTVIRGSLTDMPVIKNEQVIRH